MSGRQADGCGFAVIAGAILAGAVLFLLGVAIGVRWVHGS